MADTASSRCSCAACAPEDAAPGTFAALMHLCPSCGNKRCPRAADHTRACTGSNAPGQPGSLYEDAPGGGQDYRVSCFGEERWVVSYGSESTGRVVATCASSEDAERVANAMRMRPVVDDQRWRLNFARAERAALWESSNKAYEILVSLLDISQRFPSLPELAEMVRARVVELTARLELHESALDFEREKLRAADMVLPARCAWCGESENSAHDGHKFAPYPRERTMWCARCQRETQSYQGHFWLWCKVTGTARDWHFCCPDRCQLEISTKDKKE